MLVPARVGAMWPSGSGAKCVRDASGRMVGALWGGPGNRATCTGLGAPWRLTRLGFLPAVVAAADGVEAAAAIEAFLFHRVDEGVHDAVHLFGGGAGDD